MFEKTNLSTIKQAAETQRMAQHVQERQTMKENSFRLSQRNPRFLEIFDWLAIFPPIAHYCNILALIIGCANNPNNPITLYCFRSALEGALVCCETAEARDLH